jgi:ABC-type Mn2+/Zn2+ transport system ATPase subunit
MNWTMTQVYDFRNRGIFAQALLEDRSKCLEDENHQGLDSMSNSIILTSISLIAAFIASLTQI